MPDPQPSYNEALYEARQSFLADGGPRDELLRRLYREYAQMLVRIQSEAGEEIITEARAERLRANVRREMNRLEDHLAGQLDASALQAAQLAATAHSNGVAAASQAAGRQISADFAAVPRRALEQMMVRRGIGQATTFKTLLNRNVEEAADDIDRKITSAIGRGQSSRRLTREIAQDLARNDPQLQQALQNLGPRGGRTLQAIEDGEEAPEGEELDRAKRLLYDARRIAVSEMNNAFTEANRVSNAESPIVDLVRWRTSTKHAALESSPDICDFLEKADLHGFGWGLYHPATVPANPHPFCMCWTRAVLKDESDWGDEGRDVPEPAAPEADDVRSVLDGVEGKRTLTDAFVNRQAKAAKEHLALAYKHQRTPEGTT